MPPDGRAPPAHIGDPDFDAERATRELAARDPKLAALIAAVGPFAMAREAHGSVYESIARAIAHQQLANKAAATIWGRVLALGGGALLPPDGLRATPDAALRGAGLSGAKLLALRDLAEKTAAGEVPTLAEAAAMEQEALIERLTRVRGVGRWTAEMFLMFGLGRPDVLPVGDFGVRNGCRVAYGLRALPTAAALTRRGARWKPWRTVASWYLWRASERG